MKILYVLFLSCLCLQAQTNIIVPFSFTETETIALNLELERVNKLFIDKHLPPIDLSTMIQGQYRATHLRSFTNNLAGIQATNLLNAFKLAPKVDQDAIKAILKVDVSPVVKKK